MSTPRIVLAAAALAAPPCTLSADVLVYTGLGEVTFADPGGPFAVGQAFSVEITLDVGGLSDDLDPSPNAGLFLPAEPYSIRVIVPDAAFDEIIQGFNVSTFNDAGSSAIDSFSFSGNSLTITIRDEDGQALGSDAWPTTVPPFGLFDIATISYFPPGTPPNFGGSFSDFTVSGGPSACAPDLAPPGSPDGVLNFFDISEFIGLFSAGDLAADFAPAGAPDGVLNFFDVSEYLARFQAGCP